MASAVLVFCQSLVGVVFLVSSASKLNGRKAYQSFEASVRAMGAIPAWRARPAAALVAAGELGVALAMLPWPVRAVTAAGFTLAAILLASFTFAIVTVLRRGARVSCRCFGGGAAPFGPQHAVRNVLLAAAAIAGGATTFSSAALIPMAAAVAVSAALVGAILIARLDDIMALFATSPTRR